MKVVAKICNVLFFAIVAVLIAAAGALLLMQAFGYKPLAILSGSMEPLYRVNGLVIVNTGTQPEEIAVGDVIAFRLNENTVVTHRVTGIDARSRTFVTKGDANDTEDLAPVPFDSMIGRARFHIPLIGYVLMNLKTRQGMAMGAILLGLLIVLFAVPALAAPAKRAKGRRAAE
jgi:signal peptidase